MGLQRPKVQTAHKRQVLSSYTLGVEVQMRKVGPERAIGWRLVADLRATLGEGDLEEYLLSHSSETWFLGIYLSNLF